MHFFFKGFGGGGDLLCFKDLLGQGAPGPGPCSASAPGCGGGRGWCAGWRAARLGHVTMYVFALFLQTAFHRNA